MGHNLREHKLTLPQSLQPLIEIAVHDACAEGCAIYRLNFRTGRRELGFAWGAAVPDSDPAGFTMEFPLRVDEGVDGILTFVFRTNAVTDDVRTLLERVARSIEAVWRLTLLPDTYARKAARVGELEAELADAKIADRARGMLTNNERPSGAADTIVRHVESVLRPGQMEVVMGQLTAEIEKQIAERALASRAKTILQTRYGMSEDQAHVHLRLVSRKSRKRLSDVARDFLNEPNLQSGPKE